MAVSTKPWDGSASRYPSTEAYCKACLIDLNPGNEKVQAQCKLPVYEPNGDLNANGLRAAIAVLQGSRGGVDAPASAKRTAARKAVRLAGMAGMTPSDALKRMAGG